MFMCGKSYVIPFVFKRFSKLNNFNLLLIPDPCLTRSLFLFFINSRVLKFLRVAKRFRLALTNSGGAMEQEASACRCIERVSSVMLFYMDVLVLYIR